MLISYLGGQDEFPKFEVALYNVKVTDKTKGPVDKLTIQNLGDIPRSNHKDVNHVKFSQIDTTGAAPGFTQWYATANKVFRGPDDNDGTEGKPCEFLGPEEGVHGDWITLQYEDASDSVSFIKP